MLMSQGDLSNFSPSSIVRSMYVKFMVMTVCLLTLSGCNYPQSKDEYIDESCQVTYDQYDQGTTGADSVLACQEYFGDYYDSEM